MRVKIYSNTPGEEQGPGLTVRSLLEEQQSVIFGGAENHHVVAIPEAVLVHPRRPAAVADLIEKAASEVSSAAR